MGQDPILGEEVEQKPTQPRPAARVGGESPEPASRVTGVTYRVRVTRVDPEQPATIVWRYGGEGLGGEATFGNVTRERPIAPSAPEIRLEETGDEALRVAEEIDVTLETPTNPDRLVIQGDTYDEVFLMPGVWSRENPIRSFGGHRGNLSLTFGVAGKDANVKTADLEFEFLHGTTLLRRFSVAGVTGNALGVMVPFHRLNADGSPKPEFARDVGSLLEYVQRKRAALLAAPGMDRPVPRLYAISTDCYGFGSGGYAVRTSDPATFLAEFEILRLIGMNGTVNVPAFFSRQRSQKEGIAAEFARIQQGGHAGGYQIPTVGSVNVGRGVKKPAPKPGDGCPYYPPTVSRLTSGTVGELVEASLAKARALGVHQIWARTVDEIGSVFDGAPEGKEHQGSCPHCRKAFREFVEADGRTPADFGATSWDDIRSMYGYWSRNYWDSLAELSAAKQQAQAAWESRHEKMLEKRVRDGLEGPDSEIADALAEQIAPSGDDIDSAMAKYKAAQKRLDELEWQGRLLEVPPGDRKDRLSPEGKSLLWYYSARFNCESSARCFEPLRKAYDAANERKRRALARGENDTPDATQPWAYSFALRGNTFLLSGHSLDFFNFYRHADNAFVYETSNRDWRVWPWDSYLCDVGRTLSRFMGKQFGVYVKAHRGAPVQRCLAAVARGVRMIYWYTYGPEYVKGDSFGGNVETLKEIAHVNRLIAGAEDVTYDSDWALPAEVAVVRPLTSEYLSGSASYENAKWVYIALAHAHIPVDALDEGLLMSEDLSRYKAIVISGCHIRRDVARKLAAWVEAGGTLVTTGWGMARDESNRPLDDVLGPVFGLAERGKFEAWGSVPGYGATRLGAVSRTKEPPRGAEITGRDPLLGTFMPVVGREILKPRLPEDIMATCGDGGAVAVRHRHGKGTAWLIGSYAGVEYAWEAMTTTDKDQKWYRKDKRSWIAGPVLGAGVRPVVDAEGSYGIWQDAALVEGHMLRNRNTGKLAVILINWSHHIDNPVTVRIRGAGDVTRCRSVATGADFTLTREGDLAAVTLPKMDEGEVLLLDP